MPFYLPGACGIGGSRLGVYDLGMLAEHDFASITVVADGFPERSVTVTRP